MGHGGGVDSFAEIDAPKPLDLVSVLFPFPISIFADTQNACYDFFFSFFWGGISSWGCNNLAALVVVMLFLGEFGLVWKLEMNRGFAFDCA